MSGIKPTDGAGADASEYCSPLVGCDQKLTNAETPPNAHHLQGVSSTNVDNIH
jgi:hypothetical protein